MLDALAALARRRGVLVAAAALVVVALFGPALLDDDGDGDDGGEATGATTSVATTTTAAEATTTTVPAEVPEVDREGSGPDTSLYGGEHVAGSPPGDDRRAFDQDRAVGGDEPARISGFSAWASAVDAAELAPDGTAGPWVRVQVRVLNRDEGPQPYTFADWTLVGPDGVSLQAQQASQDFSLGASLPANSEVTGELWFRPRTDGRHWLLYRPQSDRARGVWAVAVPPG